MSDYVYLVDTNALYRLTVPQRASDFFLQCCRIPSEVLFEASELPDITELRSVEHPTTCNLLSVLSTVMEKVAVGDVSLVDFYSGKGSADPILIACGVEMKQTYETQLFARKPIIVSDDKAVRSMAASFEIECLSGDEFITLLMNQNSKDLE